MEKKKKERKSTVWTVAIYNTQLWVTSQKICCGKIGQKFADGTFYI